MYKITLIAQKIFNFTLSLKPTVTIFKTYVMPHYISRGSIPHKRHTQFRKPDGGLYSEQLVSTEGFSNIYSIIYHSHPPTVVTKIDPPVNVAPVIANDKNMQHRCYKGFKVRPESDYLHSRRYVLVNKDVYISLAAPQQSMSTYFSKTPGLMK